MDANLKTPIHCVGIVCLRGDEVLLVRRKNDPGAGKWSIPGGRIEPGESEIAACRRELFEETQIRIHNFEKIETVIAEFDGDEYHLHDYLAEWDFGEPVAGDDALEARFVRRSDLQEMQLWSKTIEIIEQARQMQKAIPPRSQIS